MIRTVSLSICVVFALAACVVVAPENKSTSPAPSGNASPATNASSVAGLQDLVGVKGASGETALQSRGYTWVRTDPSGDTVYSYWRQTQSGQCISVRTADGRYASIVATPAFDCEQRAAEAPAGQAGTGFETVCGVIVGGKPSRYKCKIEDHYEGTRKTQSVLYFPDQTLTMVWMPGRVVELRFEGMVPKTTSYATAEGETNFVFEDKTYFYISDPNMARSEVEHFEPQ